MAIMALQNEQKSYTELDTTKLFFALAEQLKLPLLQISRQAELANLLNKKSSSQKHDNVIFDSIQTTAQTSLQLIDSFILSTNLQTTPDDIELRPVSLSAVLADVAHAIQSVADNNNCDIELHIAGKYGPVLAQPKALQVALVNLGQVFVQAQSEHTLIGSKRHRPVIKLAAHRTSHGITAGLFSDIEGLNTDMLKRAKQMYGKSRQPLTQFLSSNGAGVFIADSLLKHMSSGLRVAHHQNMSGLAATFLISPQLELV